jgi:hypothetical protein
MRGATLLQWLESWQGQSLTFRETAGEIPVLRLDKTDSSSGQYWMRNSTTWRNGASACSLSSILETGAIDPRYYLTQRACAGILRRAENRGKELPPMLRRALEAVALGSDAPETLAGKTA